MKKIKYYIFSILKKIFLNIDPLLILSFVGGLIPALFIIHIIAVDFTGFYYLSLSFLQFKSYAYQMLYGYCNNPINTGVNARAPLVPLLMALFMSVFGRNLFAVYLPFFIARILIFPISYLTAKEFLPKKLAFLSILFLLFIPKLQTYSFSSFEADIFIALFYILSVYTYLKSDRLKNTKYFIASSIFLGFASLSKQTGLALSIGIILSVLLQNIHQLKSKIILRKLTIYILIFSLMIGPFLIWTYLSHDQIYLSTHRDKSINYILGHLPSLILTIPNYLGISFLGGFKSKIIAFTILLIYFIGIIISIIKRRYVLVLPTIITLIFISTVSTCLLSGTIIGSYEFITILGFTMIPSGILLVVGTMFLANIIWKLIFKSKTPTFIYFIIISIILIKFINNYYSSPFTLEFIPDEYYISMPTILKNNQTLPNAEFKTENSLRIFSGPSIHNIIRKQFTQFRFSPFSQFYKIILLTYLIFSYFILFFIKNNKEKLNQ